MTYRYYAFYVQAEGMQRKCVEFDQIDDVLALVKRAKVPESSIRDLRVIYGEELEFEPATYVETYRVVRRG